MRRTGIAAAALVLALAAALTGCQSREVFGKEPEELRERMEEESEEVQERAEEETGETEERGEERAEESWEYAGEEAEESQGGSEDTESERAPEKPETAGTIYWTVSVDDYKVSLQDEIPDASLKLVVHKGSMERVIQVYEKKLDYNSPEEFTAKAFENLLGHNGFCVYEDFQGFGYLANYYAIEEDGEPILLAASWTLPDGHANGPTDHMIDLDGDGDRELICNVMYLADGACRTLIYHYEDGWVWQGFGDELLEEELDEDTLDWANCRGSQYLPEEHAIRIWYPSKDKSGDFDEKDYEIDLDKLEMMPYEYTGWR